MLIPTLPPAGVEIGADEIMFELEPVANIRPPILIESWEDTGRETLVPIMILLGPT